MAEKIDVESAIFGTSEALRPWPWPWIGSYGILSCITQRPLPAHQISLKLAKLFCGQTNCRDPSKFKVKCQKSGRIKFRHCAVVYELLVICQLPLYMAEETDLEKCNFRNFRSPVTLTLDRVIQHTIVHQSSTSIYIPNFTEIGKTFCGWRDARTYRHFRLPLMSYKSTRGSRQQTPKFLVDFPADCAEMSGDALYYKGYGLMVLPKLGQFSITCTEITAPQHRT